MSNERETPDNGKANEPGALGREELEGLSVIRLLDWHWLWAQDKAATDRRASLAMKSNAFEANIKLRIELEKLAASGDDAAFDMHEFLQWANERFTSETVDGGDDRGNSVSPDQPNP